jgi:uncharacterized membrane protein YjfL (UPF0719 family)
MEDENMFLRLLMGSIYFLFAFAVSIVTIYLCFKVVIRLTRYNDVTLLKHNNLAVAFVQAAAFVAMAIMIRNALYPIAAVFEDFWLSTDKNPMQYGVLLGRAIGYLGVTLLLSLASICAALKLFQRLTRDIEEEKEIANNNTAVGLLLAGVLVAFAIMIESGIADFVNALLPMSGLLR